MAILTATTFFFGGIAREQVCIYACPWPRIQAAMMDEDTITIGYREWRGEPRKHSEAVKDGVPMGDCIDCMACVNVCPMGIDIRNGQQMECITCGLCIDACDEVMERIGKPRGLIDYFTLEDEQAERLGQVGKPILRHVFRPRTILYTALWSLVGFGLLFALFIRSPIDMTVAQVRNPIFVTMSDGSVRNTYDFRLRNMQNSEAVFGISLGTDENLSLSIEGAPGTLVTVPPDTMEQFRVYVTASADDPASTAERTDLRFWIVDLSTQAKAYEDSHFSGRTAQ
jgi:cytochrome c oxidase accessory protein FixG